MNELAASVPPGADGLTVLPYGNGAERSLSNRCPGAAFVGLDLNRHSMPHLLRAAQEGIVCALNYGLEGMRALGIESTTVRAGNANMFLSPIFCQTFAALTGAQLEVFTTDGSQGAARGAGIGAGFFTNLESAFRGLNAARRYEPNPELRKKCLDIYGRWKQSLQTLLGG